MDLKALKDLQKRYEDGPGNRVLSEMAYALRLCRAEGLNEAPARAVLLDLWNRQKRGFIDGADWTAAEDALVKAYGAAAKKYTVLCVGHAHIDMNWMWGWDETVPVALDTFETVLMLMKEFPEFTFAQSQASVYEIVEKFAPPMLDEIRRRVREGRWEVTASTWVEADRNMGTGESIARHLLYTRQYLSGLLGIPMESMCLDFEPDTFGHGAHTATALAQGGVRWYYHCRGYDGPPLYRWRAPSGAEILSYREPDWYLGPIAPELAVKGLDFCAGSGMTTALWVYGVGDHGGGPTRRDLQRIVEYGSWPVFPRVRFGRMEEFYRQAEDIRDTLPVVEGELNFIFPGCYTTQTRIKDGNFRCQALLTETEAMNAAASLQGGGPAASFAEHWKPVLFNQFHDIVTGSGVIATRERAMGQYQQVRAAAGALRSQTLRAVAARVDTSAWADGQDADGSLSEGAGVGFAAGRASQTGRHAGRRRLFHIFNPSPYERDEVAELTLWDYDGDPALLAASDKDGRPLPIQSVRRDYSAYWGHHYVILLVRVKVPALGRSLCVIEPLPDEMALLYPMDSRVERVAPWVLDNECIRAAFDQSGRLVSLTDKQTGRELLARPAGFGFIEEDPGRGMTAWVVGRTMKDTCVHTGPVRLLGLETGPLRTTLRYEVPFGDHSLLTVSAILDSGSPLLRLETQCRFLEWGNRQTQIPQLYFAAVPAVQPGVCRYDAPLGPVERPPLPMDVPALSWASLAAAERGLMVSAPGKYGYRYDEGRLKVTLIRGSFDPDPYPELGEHAFTVALGPVDPAPDAPYRQADRLAMPLSAVSDGAHGGTLAAEGTGIAVEGPARMLCFKAAEDGRGYVLRLMNPSEEPQTIRVTLPGVLASAAPADILERPLPGTAGTVSGNTLSLEMGGHGLTTLRLEFKD